MTLASCTDREFQLDRIESTSPGTMVRPIREEASARTFLITQKIEALSAQAERVDFHVRRGNDQYIVPVFIRYFGIAR